jgi:hypothetical protein
MRSTFSPNFKSIGQLGTELKIVKVSALTRYLAPPMGAMANKKIPKDSLRRGLSTHHFFLKSPFGKVVLNDVKV